ncbi:MAG TPA: hypothetical protein VGN81_04620 [Pseudonocardiaceae bacterium]|jgi:hypothetical protein
MSHHHDFPLIRMGRKNMAFSCSAGTALVLAAVACVAGALLPTVVAAIVAGVLFVAGLVAFSLRRADHVLDAIIKQEVSPGREEWPKKTA